MKRHSLTQAQNSDTMPVYGFIIDRGAGIARFLGNDCARGLVLSDIPLTGEQIRIEYIPLPQVAMWDENPKDHDIDAIADSISRYGFRDPVGYDTTLKALVEGHGRAHALIMMKEAHEEPPRGIATDASGEWFVPMLFGVDAESKAMARRYAIDHNNLTLSGNLEVWDVAKIWNEDEYTALLQELAADDVLPVSVDGDDLDALLKSFDPPTLDELYAEYGDHNNDTFNPVIRVQVGAETMELYKSLMEQAPGEDDSTKFAALMGAVDATVLNRFGQ